MMNQFPFQQKKSSQAKPVILSLLVILLIVLLGVTRLSIRLMPNTSKEKIAELLASQSKEAQEDDSSGVYAPEIIQAEAVPTGSNSSDAAKRAHTPVAGAIQHSSVDNMPVVYIPAGTFIMGANKDRYASSVEGPQHKVYTDGFWMDKYLVTNAMYTLCVQAGVCHYGISPHIPTFSRYVLPAYANRPVVYVSWYNAQTYCAWQGGRLPTEAEWEKASRAPDNRLYPWGNNPPTSKQANFNNVVADTTDVNAYPNGRSYYRIFDLGGNVREWVSDWYQVTSYSGFNNPIGPNSGEKKVLKGASYKDPFKFSRGSNRQSHLPWSPGINRGFRCVIP